MTFIALALAATTLTAQPQAKTPEPTKPADSAAVVMPSPFRLPTQNVKVEVTITEQAGKGAPVTQTVSLIVADDRTSRIRTTTGGMPFNVDAKANVTADRRVLLELAVVYSAFRGQMAFGDPGANEQTVAASNRSSSAVNNSLTLLLTPGVSTIAARNSDTGERVVTVEVKADILK